VTPAVLALADASTSFSTLIRARTARLTAGNSLHTAHYGESR
jgi:hypothetical protein